MNKQDVINDFKTQLEADLQMMIEAAEATRDAATNEESKPENQYDTRALEASYLAGAQAQRAQEIKEVLVLFKTLDFKNLSPTDPVQSTALVQVNIDGRINSLLIMPKGGGVKLNHHNQQVQIVTPSSLLGESIIGQSVGDEVEFEVGNQIKVCKILSLI